jgi:uncharacterized protein (TIGR03083 family)
MGLVGAALRRGHDRAQGLVSFGMTDLQVLVEAWRSTTDSVLTLLSDLPEHEWDLPTDCPGWDVRHVAAHLAAVEDELAGGAGPAVAAGDAREVSSAYTQAGVDARADHTPAQLIEEIRAAAAIRYARLGNLAAEPTATPDRTPGGIGWDWRTLLRNRVLDVWVHEQDIRRAVKRPGGMQGPGAEVTYATLIAAVPYVIGKRAAAPPGTTVVVQVGARVTAYSVDEDGRCRLVDRVDHPTTRLSMDMETFTVLAAGRRDPASCTVAVEGDARLAERILRSLAVTP